MKSGHDRWDVVLLLFYVAGMLGSLGAAVLLGALALVLWLQFDPESALFPAWTAIGLATIGVLGAPAALGRARAVLGGASGPARRPPLWPVVASVVVLPAALGLGYLTFETQALSGILGPPAHFLAAGAPVLLTSTIALRNGPLLSARRRWGHFLMGLWVVPPISLLVEALALIPAVLAIVIGLAASSSGQQLLMRLAEAASASEAELQSLGAELLAQPVALVIVVGFVAVAVPLLEEALKTMVLWPLLTRKIHAGEAFLAGILGGAGFALFESLFNPQPGGGWMATMMARAGTPLIHCFATGVACWGLHQAVQEKRWARLIVAYSGAALLHGLWNLGALGLGVGSASGDPQWAPIAPDGMALIGVLGGGLLVAMSLVAVSGLMLMLRRLPASKEADQPAS